MHIPYLQEGCPWYSLSSWALPNVKWCELQHCSWIVEPYNTWSNLAYLLIAVYLLVNIKHRNLLVGKMFGYTFLFVGFSSFVYHMSYTFVLQILDFIAMYALMFLMIILNIKRMNNKAWSELARIYLFGVLLFTVITIIFYYSNIPIQSLVFILVLGVTISEFKVKKKNPVNISYKPFFIGLVLILCAATFSVLDVTRMMCDNQNYPYLQGHALWHIIGSLSLFSVYLFYRQFTILNPK